jgi:hypothetical protein
MPVFLCSRHGDPSFLVRIGGKEQTSELKICSLRGQYSHPVRVVAFNTAEGWARDVTEDFARAVLSKAQSEQRSIGTVAQEFLERSRCAVGRLSYRYLTTSTRSYWHLGHSKVRLSWSGLSSGSIETSHISEWQASQQGRLIIRKRGMI